MPRLTIEFVSNTPEQTMFVSEVIRWWHAGKMAWYPAAMES